jgi:hypothetical protein
MRISTQCQPVKLDGSGNGTGILNGPKPGQKWTITQVSVLCTGVAVPVFKYYKGTVNDGNFISGTFTGNQDTDSAPNIELFPGEYLTGVWTGGSSGAVGTFTVQGTID